MLLVGNADVRLPSMLLVNSGIFAVESSSDSFIHSQVSIDGVRQLSFNSASPSSALVPWHAQFIISALGLTDYFSSQNEVNAGNSGISVHR